jgi:predicted outer membrane repeat protein
VQVAGACALIENIAGSFGGAIDADSSVTLSLDGTISVRLNRAANGGGLSIRQAAGILLSYMAA